MNDMTQFLKDREEYSKKVRTKEYLDWVYDVLNRKYSYDDEAALYEHDNLIDAENGKILGYFTTYLEELAKEQSKPNLLNGGGTFDAFRVYVHYKDLYFCHILMVGQGALSIITKTLEGDFSEDVCIELV